MKKILLLTDFSEASHNALHYIRSFLSDTVADIHLLCAYPLETDGFYEPAYVAQTAKNAFSDQLEDIVAGLRREAVNDWHTFRATARAGSLLEAVQAMIGADQYDLVVVGAKKDGTSELFGNSATTLVRQLRVNVMVIPADALPHPVSHVVLAADFANLRNCKLLLPLKELVTLKGARLTMLTVDVPQKGVIRPEQELRIRSFLKPISPLVAHVQADKPKLGIRQFVDTHPVDLLVIIPRHKNWQDVLTGASVTRSLAFVPPVPMITLYDDGRSDQPVLINDLSHLDYAL